MQESLEASLVRIRTADGRVVGAGFLVGERHILTCAHVISQALGLSGSPLDPPQGAVSLDFPLVPPRTLLTASVIQWCPPLSDGRGDIAGLELQGDPPAAAEVVRFAPAEDVWEHPFRAFGFPAGYDDGVWATGRLLGRQATDWVMIEDMKTQGFAVAPGFSGTPVWDTRLQGVVGMVVAASRLTDLKAAFVLPLDVLVAAWPLIEPVTRQRVFLSAAPADADFAARLTTDLEARGIVVWNEQHTPGEDHADKEERVRQAIRAAQAVVLVVSSQTRSSRTVKEHLRLADLYQRRLILVWVGDDEHAQPQHYGWRETVWVDAHDTHYAAALQAIEATLSQRRSISDLLGPSGAATEQEPRNPYKGLRAFTADDAGDFFGRDRLIDELVKDIAGMLAAKQPTGESGRLLTIIGPSGSGKSSVVMAGLLPDLQHGALPGSVAWVYLSPMVPGKRPIEALGLILAAHFPDRSFTSIREDLEDDTTRGLHVLATQMAKQQGSRVVLLVDQFEELFTQTVSEDERRRFIDLLLTVTTEPRSSLLVLLTLRADFYHRLMQYPELYRLIEAHHKPVLPMEVEDLRATIEQPAALPDVQLTFEGNLVGDLLFEMQGQAGALPLLQFTLEQLFERRSGHRLTLQAYREIGGVKGALSQHAEQTFAALPSEEHRRLVRALFVRLIEPGVSEQDTTRRRATLSEFSLLDPTQTGLLRETIDAFIAARLLTTNEVSGTTTIEVSHEALIREWKRLKDWLHEARDDIALQQAISEDVAEWEQRGKPKDRLYRGSQLKEAQAWARRNTPSRNEAAFLEASDVERQRQEREEQARQRRELDLQRSVVKRQRYFISMVGVTAVVVVIALVVALILQAQVLASFPPTVTNLNDSGPGSLRDAILHAPSGSVVTFAKNLRGTIRLTSGELKITRSVIISGPDAASLTIDGGNTDRVFYISQGASALISNVTVRHGRATYRGGNNVDDGGGGGIFSDLDSTLILTRSVVSENISNLCGSGIDSRGFLSIADSVISNNREERYKGLVASHGADMNDSIVLVNLSGFGCGNGGGVQCRSVCTIVNSTIVGNAAALAGGGIDNSGTLTVSNSTIWGNTAPVGGGIYNFAALTLTHSTISDNTAGDRGGGIYTERALDVDNSTISDNTAGDRGGGIANLGGRASCLHCTIYRNTASIGGGISNEDGYNSPGTVTIDESIVADDHADKGPDVLGSISLYNDNLIQNISDAKIARNNANRLITGESPNVGPLQKNGGITATHALLPGSPAIDVTPQDVNRSICGSDKDIDQRGVKRPQGAGCDLGAYEYTPTGSKQ